MKFSSAIALITLACASPVVSLATSYSLSAAFSGTAVDVNGSNHSYDFGGAFSAIFDDAGVADSGFSQLTVSPLSVSLTHPTIGSTTFDATNTGIDLVFFDHVFTSFAFGGNLNNPNGTSLGTDDFAFYVDPLGLSPSTLIYVTTVALNEFSIDTNASVKFSLAEVKTVPEQGMTGLYYLAAALAMTLHARRPAKAGRNLAVN